MCGRKKRGANEGGRKIRRGGYEERGTGKEERWRQGKDREALRLNMMV